MPKESSSKRTYKQKLSLADDIIDTYQLKQKKSKMKSSVGKGNEEEQDKIDSKFLSKVNKQMKQLEQDENAEQRLTEGFEEDDDIKFSGEGEYDLLSDFDPNEGPPDFEELNEEEAKVFEMFAKTPSGAKQSNNVGVNLADLIMQKIHEKEKKEAKKKGAPVPQRGDVDIDAVEESINQRIPPKIRKAYSKIGKILTKYKGGSLPKAFKVLPNLSNWEELLFITKPQSWSSQATFQATRIFASNLNEKMAQRYYNLVLLPKIRDTLEEHKKLNYHYFQSLLKACYKPAAFFKGIVIPLAESGTCTLKEAHVVCSVIKKMHLPILHSGAALMKLTDVEYDGTITYFIKTFIEKKYALPPLLVDKLADYIHKFTKETRQLPLVWHQMVLSFVGIYKNDLTKEHKVKIYEVLKVHNHRYITEQIRGELSTRKSKYHNQKHQPKDVEME